VDGQIGLEETPEAYILRLVSVFREVRRVLRDDGTLWVNIGDSYATGAGKVGAQAEAARVPGSRGGHEGKHRYSESARATTQPNRLPLPGLKAKDLIGVPWMLAFALRADGWYLRQDIIWHKPNPMPESVKDRCTKAHEYVFMFSKSARYYYDAPVIAEPAVETSIKKFIDKGHDKQRGHGIRHAGFNGRYADKLIAEGVPTTRNRRSVWTLATMPTPEAHFATFPLELPEICLLAGCPQGGVVLDPFAGVATTGLAAIKHGRKFLGIELNEQYIQLAYQRVQKIAPLLCDGPTLFAGLQGVEEHV
jgi:DNA modification methylase